MKLAIYPEGDGYVIVHNHFDCPVCKTENASTDAFFDIEDLDSWDTDLLTCQVCDAQFRPTRTVAMLGDWEWEKIEKKGGQRESIEA